MKANKLKTISGGIILKSESCLIVNHDSLSNHTEKMSKINEVVNRFKLYLNQRDKDA